MNILVVEDDEVMAEVLVHVLRDESHDVDRAADGCTALRLTGDTGFDLILLDLMLPGMNGLEVARHRQLRLRDNSVALLMLTARDALSDIVTGLDAGPMTILRNPFHSSNCWLASGLSKAARLLDRKMSWSLRIL